MAQPDRAAAGCRALTAADTIFALSSGSPPAAIAIMRVSGPAAFAAAQALAGMLPAPRAATLRALRDANGQLLDLALVLIFPAASSATGEDLVELHCHGGRAVVAAVDAALATMPSLRRATAGEFTRRALLNGRIDLAQAEALGDLLRAETEVERVAALRGVEGVVSRKISAWQGRLLALSAEVEASIDYDEDGDVAATIAPALSVADRMSTIRDEMLAVLAAPSVERLRDGVRVVLAGPRNAGKSTLFNLLVGRDAAITSAVAGTTRDRLEAPVDYGGTAYLLIDTAGLTDETADPIEAEGIARSRAAMAAADLVIWMGDTSPDIPDALWVWPRADLPDRAVTPAGALAVSRADKASIAATWQAIAAATTDRLGVGAGDVVLNARQQDRLRGAVQHLTVDRDPLIFADNLRWARNALIQISAFDAVDAMLDQLFDRFCVGK